MSVYYDGYGRPWRPVPPEPTPSLDDLRQRIEAVLREALKAQNGFAMSDGTVYMGSARPVDVAPIADAIAAALQPDIDTTAEAIAEADKDDDGVQRDRWAKYHRIARAAINAWTGKK